MSLYQGKVEKEYHCCDCIDKSYKKPLPAAAGLIDEILKKYLCQKAGQGSSCSLFSDCNCSIRSTDKRLEYWAKILDDRKKLACRIHKTTGKRISNVLYNQLEGHRQIQNVKRIIDYAERLNPTNLTTRRQKHIHDANIFETLPRSERLGRTPSFEIVGTPEISQAEQWINYCTGNNKSFLMSPFLQRKLKAKRSDMANVLGFYPDIDRLQVLGQRIHKHPPYQDSKSDSQLSFETYTNEESHLASEIPEYCIQINDTVLQTDGSSSESLRFHLQFTSEPFEKQVQTVAKITNLGSKHVQFVWIRTKPAAFSFKSDFPAFIFNQNAFQISSGETEDIEVLFMSNERMVCEEEWWLRTEPDFFEGENKILVKLSGECFMPDDCLSSMIVDLLESLMRKTIPGMKCETGPESSLRDVELFEKHNPGLKCGMHDIQKFKQIYKKIRTKGCEPSWDMNLQTIKDLIERITDFKQRNTYNESVMKIIREMRQRAPDSDLNIRILLARRVVVAALDCWEIKAIKISEFIEQTPMEILAIKLPFDFFIEQCETAEDKRKLIQHNALYIQMYSSLIGLANDIVSFVENCLLLYTF